MKYKLSVEIEPASWHFRYIFTKYVLCDIKFCIECDDKWFYLESETSDKIIKKLLLKLDDFLEGKLTGKRRTTFRIPYIIGEGNVYPYSIKARSDDFLTFYYKDGSRSDSKLLEFDISKDDARELRDSIVRQYSEYDWDSLETSALYRIFLPEGQRIWCYSAKEFRLFLEERFVGKNVKEMYVSAKNYADPCTCRTNFVNYYLGEKLFILFDDILLDLDVHGEGLFSYRVFEKGDYTVTEPRFGFIEDGDNEYCKIGNAYGFFTDEYTSAVESVFVEETNSWSYEAMGFDSSLCAEPVELPYAVIFRLANGCIVSVRGCDDDFYIELTPQKN